MGLRDWSGLGTGATEINETYILQISLMHYELSGRAIHMSLPPNRKQQKLLPIAVVFRVWPLKQQQQHHLGTS